MPWLEKWKPPEMPGLTLRETATMHPLVGSVTEILEFRLGVYAISAFHERQENRCPDEIIPLELAVFRRRIRNEILIGKMSEVWELL